MPRASNPSLRGAGDAEVVRAVIEWFAREGRVLPWREASAYAWGVLVSEVMLQQTPVSRVLPVWRDWMQRWPTPGALAAARQEDVVRAWGRLGYPMRARRLWQCAGMIVRDHGGIVPSDEATLRGLPGLGDYTAAAVAAFGFGTRTVVLDTNVRRVIARVWEGVALPPGHITRAERERAAALVPEDPAESVRWNVGAMELGALVCRSRAPLCDKCPISSACAWLKAGRPEAAARRAANQPWHGSDREVRGRVMALLRGSEAPVNVTGHASLEDVEPGQLDRCLTALVADGLARVVSEERGSYSL